MSYEIRDVQTGEVLAARAPDTLVTPASTMKVLTTAAVFARLPRDTRWSTQLYGPEPDAQGVIWGDLWLVGGGDPSFGAQRFKGRGDAHIEDKRSRTHGRSSP